MSRVTRSAYEARWQETDDRLAPLTRAAEAKIARHAAIRSRPRRSLLSRIFSFRP